MIRETLTEQDIRHRTDFAEYATTYSASDWHRELLDRLYPFWVSVNRDHFCGACIEPHILIAEPKSTRAIGDHATVSGWGSKNQIRLRPSVIRGGHKMVKDGDEYAEGRYLVTQDILLHETVHQYCDEVLHTPEDSYKGHGPAFAAECNRIGEKLGLPPVRPAKARGRNKDLPSCAQWPHNVRPPGYYLGALAEPATDDEGEDDDDQDETQTFPCPFDPAKAAPVIEAHFPGPALGEVVAELQARIAATVIEENTLVADNRDAP